RRSAGRRLHHLGRLTKILRPNRGWSDHTQRFRVLTPEIVEPVNGTARDAQRLARTNSDGASGDGPRQDAFEAVDGLLVVVVTVRRSRQPLTGTDRELEDCDAASRDVPGDQESDRQRPVIDGLIRGVHRKIRGPRSHLWFLW